MHNDTGSTSFIIPCLLFLQAIPLKKYKELGETTPCVVRVTETPSNSHLPEKLVQEDLLLHSIVPHRKVICQCVDLVGKDGQLYFSSQRFSIPLGYNGWFEILSEDGKTISPSKTIEHITQRAPDKFLVRSRTKAYLSEENGEPDYDRTKIVEKGEVMTIIGQLSITHGWRKQKKNILHCLDNNGVDIYFDFKTTGQFSPMAGRTNISGVHNIEGLVGQFRLPLTVRIVSGQIPRVASDNDRPGVFRLMETQKDNTALFLPLRSHQKLIPVSTRTNLQLMQACNMTEISQHQYYKLLSSLCHTKVEKYFRTMQVLVSANKQAKPFSALTLPSRRRTLGVVAAYNNNKHTMTLDTEEDVLFAEVDDLYAYVRRGGAPPKPRPRSWATNTIESRHVLMETEVRSTSQPVLATNGKPRGLLATLTAGKFPSKGSTLVRTKKLSSSQATITEMRASNNNLPAAANRSELTKSYVEKYQGSVESLQTEVDPYVDDGHYKNSTENLDITKKSRFRSMDELRELRENPRPKSIHIMHHTSTSPTIEERFIVPVSPQGRKPVYKRSSIATSPTKVITFVENNAKFPHFPVQAS